ncbi:hypothetical protein BB560_005590 [Smittium megazygosporum]|uniref:Nudix hydrolase domain-containing protein n=1 Tax=Smittium megazygosporum TaxID=133381 RepID=A0A2T9Z2T9_9FUNG|nr:hypothetical protein BB560_005590 [Smittium megazygosporum]
MAKRVENGSYSNAHVFPGGKLDPEDSSPRWKKFTDYSEKTDSALERFKICAIRETFEETGLFLAETKEPAKASSLLKSFKSSEHHNSSLFIDNLEGTDFVIPTSRLQYISRWITPQHLKRRFDTPFFLFCASEGSKSDDFILGQIYPKNKLDALYAQPSEIAFLEWLTPGEFLNPSRPIGLYPPQFYIMTILSRVYNYSDLSSLSSLLHPIHPTTPFFSPTTDGGSIATLAGDIDYGTTLPLAPLPADPESSLDLSRPLHRLYLSKPINTFSKIKIVDTIGRIPKPFPKPSIPSSSNL